MRISLFLFLLFLMYDIYSTDECPTKEQMITFLKEIEVIQYGNFRLKSGTSSSIYVDLRKIISYPDIFSSLLVHMQELIAPLDFDAVCGVPYGAVPLATALSLHFRKPLLLCRKESKNHGTGQIIEGALPKTSNVLVVEDVMTTGMSIEETINHLEAAEYIVTDIAVILDRSQDNVMRLRERGYRIHALFTLAELL